MTQDEIIEMAKQAGMRLDKHNGGFVDASEIKRFAQMVEAKASAKEREACGQLCIDEVWASTINGTAVEAFNYASKECANRIRARGEA